MSSPLHSPQSPQHESDVVNQDPQSQIINHETLDQPDPPPKSDTETLPSSQLILDPEDNSPEEEEEEEEEDDEEAEAEAEGREQDITGTRAISSGMHLYVVPPIIDPHVPVHDVTLKSPSNNPIPRLGKRKKGKGKGKPNIKKQQAIEEKLQNLMAKLNPIPFIPLKILDFAKHETLLKKLGLWDFVHIDFDRNIRVDLVAQLVATYEAKSRASYVNGFRIMVNRADLARAFKFPVKKEKGSAGGMEVDLDWEALTEDSIGFIVEFVSDWMLLHEDIWIMPNEVMNWLRVIKDGHPERVDWAGLVWFMVEKELTQGSQLSDCYYASHLQYLMKSQRGDLFLTVEPTTGEVEFDGEAKEEENVSEVGDVNVGDAIKETGEESCLMGGPSTKLTLGQDGEKEEEIKEEDVKEEMMDVEKCNESDEDAAGEEQGRWLLHGKNNLGEHFMQRCSAENDVGFGSFEDRKEEEEEEEMMEGEEEDVEEAEEGINVFPNDDVLETEGITGNLLQAMEANQIAFTSQEQDMIRADMEQMPPTSSFFNHTGKRVIDHDNDISHHALNDSNKRLRMNDSWEHNKPVDFGMCMEQIQQMTERARLCYEEKEQAYEQANINQQILLNELQKRDSVIEHLHKTRLEETQKKDGEIYRLERELYLMGTVLDGYRKALKETQKVFAEYRERAQLPEEPTYKDAGPGGLMLSTSDIEKLRKKQEEEFKMNCLIIEQKMKEAEEDYVVQFHGFFDKIKNLDKKLTDLKADAKELTELYKQRKIPQIEGKVPEIAEPQLISQTEEKVLEVAESQPIPEEEMPQVTESQPILQTEEEIPQVTESQPTLQTEEKVPEVAEPLPNE